MRFKGLMAVLVGGVVALAQAQTSAPKPPTTGAAKPAPSTAQKKPAQPNAGKITLSAIKPQTMLSANTVVATVNGEKILAKDLSAAAYDWYLGPTLDELILYALIAQEARKFKIKVTDQEILERVNQSVEGMQQQAPAGRTPTQQLRSMGLPVTRVKARAIVQLQLEKLVERGVNLKNYIHVRHILVRIPPPEPVKSGDPPKTEEQIKEEQAKNEQAAKIKIEKILADIQAGKKFEDAAKENSEDAFTKASGGDLFFRTRQEMEPAFADVAFTLKAVGDVGGPVKTRQGLHLVQLIGYGDTATAEQKKELKNRQVQMGMQDYIRKLQEAAKVKNNFVPYLPPSKMQPAMRGAPGTGPGTRPGTPPRSGGGAPPR